MGAAAGAIFQPAGDGADVHVLPASAPASNPCRSRPFIRTLRPRGGAAIAGLYVGSGGDGLLHDRRQFTSWLSPECFAAPVLGSGQTVPEPGISVPAFWWGACCCDLEAA